MGPRISAITIQNRLKDQSIIAVPGLDGHALGSFEAPEGHKVWLRDFLPSDIPNIRVLVYGYDTKLAESKAKGSIIDLAKSLVESIKAFRDNTNVWLLFPVIKASGLTHDRQVDDR